MKRRLAILALLCIAAGVSVAQQMVDSSKLEQTVESLQNSVDSLNVIISQARNRYATEPESREQIAKQLAIILLKHIMKN